MQLAVLNPPEKRPSPVLGQFHLDSRVCSSVSRQHLRQSCFDKLWRRPEAEHSGLPAGQSSRTLAQSFGVRQKPPRSLQDFVAVSGENDPASDPIEQSASEVALEIL